MKKILIISICFLLTSCFEITERIKHHNDQSGEYTLTVDFSSSWFKTKSAIFLEEIDGVKIPNEQEIAKKLADFKLNASKIEGISNISTKTNFNDYIFTLKLEYKNLKALNAVMNSLNEQKNKIHFNNENNDSFERYAAYPIPQKIANDPKKKSDLQAAQIIAIYTFDAPIKSFTNTRSKLSKNKQSVFLKHSIYNVLQSPNLMNNKIQLTY